MDKSPSTLSTLFDNIAPVYDKTNALLSFNLHKGWNKKLARSLLPYVHPNSQLLDLCAGTGAITQELLKLPCNGITLLDVSPGMLAVAASRLKDKRLQFVEADALAMPFEDKTFDAVTVAYGIRNLPDLKKGFQEVRRVLKPGGVFAILELTRPKGWFAPLHSLYLKLGVPLLGKLASGNKGAYAYLAQSVDSFLSVENIAEELKNNGFQLIASKPLFSGCATLFLAKTGSPTATR